MSTTQPTVSAQENRGLNDTTSTADLRELVNHLTPEHLAEWVEGSGVPIEITCRAVRSLHDRTIIAQRLGWKKYSENLPLGWWVSGLALATMQPQAFGQYKPDEEISLNPEDPDDTAKYVSAKGEYDAIALPHPDKDYWQRVINDPSIPIYPIEGPKKAGALIGLGYCAPALCGVTMALKKGGKELVKNLEILAVPGRPVILPWDADLATNPNVRRALIALATVLKQKGCIVFVALIPPELECKAIDDVLVHHGPEMVATIMADAIPYSQWLKNLDKQVSDSKTKDSEKKGKKKDYPAASTTAREIAENYRDKLAWESEYQLWRHYSADWLGCWDIATEESVRELIHCHLETQGWGYNAGYVSSVATILKSKLEVKAWNEQKGLIPLRDGVLNTETQELKPHAPGYRFTYQLPYKWEGRAIGCAPVEEFLLKITGNQAIAEVLLAYLAAVVTGRADAQRYLELIGGGQTGKSTFMALATMLVGEENTVSSQLKLLESNQFETAKFYRKRLILFPDSERWQGEVSILKQLTGQDPIRYERKGVQQCKDFRFEGMIILSANEAPESSDRTSGLERRKLTIALENKLPEYDGRDLKKEFAPYLPGLLKRVLDISPERVFQLIKHTERYVPAVAAKKFEQLTETNPIAAWLDERVVVGADFKAQVGTNNPDYVGKWLYANFCQYQAEMGHKGSLSLSRFKSNLKDLLKNQLKIAISEHRTSTARFINGIALRCLEDPAGNLPRPVTGMATVSDGLELKNDSPVTAETIGSVKSDGHDGFFQKSNSEVEIQAEAPKTEKQVECSGDSTENPSCPSSPAVATVPLIPDPSPQPETKPPTPIALLVERVKAAQTWAEVEAVWDADLELKTQIKAQLPEAELKRVGKLCKQAQSQSEAQVEPIAPPEPQTTQTAPPIAPPEPDAELVNEIVAKVQEAIAKNDHEFAQLIAAILKDVCQCGHADRAAIWAALTQTEQQQFRELLAPPPLARDFARRIRETIGYQSPAVAGAVQSDLERAINRGSITAADVVAVVGAVDFAEFVRLLGSPVRAGSLKSKT